MMNFDTNSGRQNARGMNLGGNLVVQYARVMEIAGGRPIIKFSGEDENSPKLYSHLKSYVPAISDRVMLINDIIIGGF